jgi:hypothetical protein
MAGGESARFTHGSPSSTIVITSPAPRVALLTMQGHARAEHVPAGIAQLTRIVKGDPDFDYFYDLWDLQGYDSPVRVDFTNFHRKFGLRSLHALTRSRVVAMGVAVANLALGNRITVHSGRESFDARLAELCRAARR